jgi:hypothetical protein
MENETVKNAGNHPANAQQGAGKPTIFQLVRSILGAAFGVQSSKTHERDFKQASPAVFIIGGLVFAVIFVVTLVMIVNMVIAK